ncbi:MAG: monovalent cation/H(+) antiporter subunit G [Acidobacteria bacterium]|nr:monovalent cation/H(+) antiporter subunit G [Acidobacteriota bacterium]
MGQVVSAVLLALGAFFSLVAAIGVLRFPDLFLRMHCSAKSATLGVSCIMLGAAVHFGDLISYTKAVAAIVFLLISAPVATHVLARAAFYAGVPLWKGTLGDELSGHYDKGGPEFGAPGAADGAEGAREPGTGSRPPA